MPLIDLRTDLKSLKYGADRQGGGDSGLPYITKDINTANTGLKFDDGLVRGGAVNAAIAGAVDTARIFKFLKDPPKGPLFIVKQVGLQLANPRLEVPKNPANIASGLPDNVLSVGTNGLLQPTRIYNLGINTLAQIPVNAFGAHLNRHGILPVQTKASTYEAVVTANNDWKTTSTNIPYNQIGNRLVGLTTKFKLGDRETNNSLSRNTTSAINSIFNTVSNLGSLVGINVPKININPQELTIDSYAAGPNSVYGIGRTTLNRYSNTEDGYKINLQTDFSRQFAGKTRNQNGQVEVVQLKNTEDYEVSTLTRSTLSANNWTYTDSTLLNNSFIGLTASTTDTGSRSQPNGYVVTPVYTNDLGKGSGSISQYPDSKNTPTAIDQTAILAYSKSNPSLRKYAQLQKQISDTTSIKTSDLGFPGTQQPNRTAEEKKQKKYTSFDRTNDILIGDDTMKIVFTPIQPFTGVETPIQFLGYLRNYDESYDSTWGDTQYVGRAEKFYIFNSFKRTANISFIVPAFQPSDIEINHKKLFDLGKKSLAYALAGQYSENALLGGVIVKATVGNYLVNTPGIITNLKFDIVENSPWDLDAKYAQYLNITVGFTVIGDKLPIYEDVVFTVQQTDTEPLPEDDGGEAETLANVRTIPQTFIDNTRNTSDQQRYYEQTLRANQQLPNRPRTATGQPNEIQQIPPPGSIRTAVLSDVLGGR